MTGAQQPPRPNALPGNVESEIRDRLEPPVDEDVFLFELSRYPHAGMRFIAVCPGERTFVILANDSYGFVQAMEWTRPPASEAFFRVYPPVSTVDGFFELHRDRPEGDLLVTGYADAGSERWSVYRLDPDAAATDLLESCAYYPLTPVGETPSAIDYRCERRYAPTTSP